jgi:hypothetical protein
MIIHSCAGISGGSNRKGYFSNPFGLSLSKPCPSSSGEEIQPFDKLRANGNRG